MGRGIEAPVLVTEVNQCLESQARWRHIVEIGVTDIPMRENALIVARAVLPGQFEALKGRVAGEVIDAEVFPTAVMLDAILMGDGRITRHPLNSDVLDLQNGVCDRAARL